MLVPLDQRDRLEDRADQPARGDDVRRARREPTGGEAGRDGFEGPGPERLGRGVTLTHEQEVGHCAREPITVGYARPVLGWHPESRFFDVLVDGRHVRCHLVDAGPRDGRVVVLLHGIAVSSWAWRRNIDVLARGGLRVLAICQKGHGWSGRGPGDYDLPALSRFVLAALDRLQVPSATWVGNSLGGAVSLWTALHHPARVERLVLINPASHVEQLPWQALRSQVAALAPVYRALVGPTLLRIPLAAIAYRNLPIDRDYMAGFWAPFEARGSMRALTATARALPHEIEALDRRLGEVQQPTLIIWGERDALLPVSGAYRLARKIPHARLVLSPEAGHCPQEEEPERVNRLILDMARGG